MKEYVGDSVYAEMDDFGVLKLTTENGLPNDPSNTIIIEPETWQSLLRFIHIASKKYQDAVRFISL